MPDVTSNVLMDDAQILFRNFEGREGQYNRKGDRNFHAILPADLAEKMLADGWNVKQLKSRDGQDEGDYHIQVSVGYKIKPPRIVILTTNRDGEVVRTDLSEDEVELLDWVDIANVDLIIRPYNYNVNGTRGVKAYLKTLLITIDEDPIEQKIKAIPKSELPAISAPEDPLAIEAGSSDEDDDVVDAEIVEDEG